MSADILNLAQLGSYWARSGELLGQISVSLLGLLPYVDLEQMPQIHGHTTTKREKGRKRFMQTHFSPLLS